MSDPNYYTKKIFFRKFISNRNEKIKVKINKPVYLDLSILKISKTLMYEFWCNNIKPKHHCNVRLCYIDTDSFIIHIKTEDVYKDIANDV